MSELDRFRADCADGVRKWQTGQVEWPATLTVAPNESTTYTVVLAIGPPTGIPSRSIPGPDPRAEPVSVQCVVAARLSPVGTTTSVEPTGWVSRTFTPTNRLSWSWSVAARSARDGQVRLEIQPAVRTVDGEPIPANAATDQADYVAEVDVAASFVQDAKLWYDDNWPLLLAMVGGLGIAALALIRWGGQLRETVRGEPGERPGPPEPSRPARRRPVGRRRPQVRSRTGRG